MFPLCTRKIQTHSWIIPNLKLLYLIVIDSRARTDIAKQSQLGSRMQPIVTSWQLGGGGGLPPTCRPFFTWNMWWKSFSKRLHLSRLHSSMDYLIVIIDSFGGTKGWVATNSQHLSATGSFRNSLNIWKVQTIKKVNSSVNILWSFWGGSPEKLISISK